MFYVIFVILIDCCVAQQASNGAVIWKPIAIGSKIQIKESQKFGTVAGAQMNDNKSKFLLKIVNKEGSQLIANTDCWFAANDDLKTSDNDFITRFTCLDDDIDDEKSIPQCDGILDDDIDDDDDNLESSSIWKNVFLQELVQLNLVRDAYVVSGAIEWTAISIVNVDNFVVTVMDKENQFHQYPFDNIVLEKTASWVCMFTPKKHYS